MADDACAKQPYSEDATLGTAIQGHLGAQLRALYASVADEALPRILIDLIARLEQISESRESAPAANDFRRDLLAALPGLRGFALSLAQPAQADDLVQETLLKAWQSQHRYTPGTNLNAWLCTILRNLFYTQHRRKRREVEDADGAAAGRLVVQPNQEHKVTLTKVEACLRMLPAPQREALVLVGAQGMTYEQAAEIMHCQVGTVKSRVSRARAYLIDTVGA